VLWETTEDFKNDMYESYLEHVKQYGIKNTQIDRIDVNGHYEKSNCRWATAKEQQRNRTTNKMITFNGETLSLAEWSERANLSQRLVQNRIRLGWDLQEALTTPVGNQGKRMYV